MINSSKILLATDELNVRNDQFPSPASVSSNNPRDPVSLIKSRFH
jgi:hypothetical protein